MISLYFTRRKVKAAQKVFFVSFSLSGQNHHVITAEVMFSVVSVCRSVCSQGGGSHVTTFGHVQSSSLGEPPPTWVPTLVHWQKLVVDLRLKGLIVRFNIVLTIVYYENSRFVSIASLCVCCLFIISELHPAGTSVISS